ncbi:hypothetical protein B1A_12789, partial [mine drainage metagenome]
MGVAWRAAAGEVPDLSWGRFMWARLVRDAAAEILPFSQLGGFVLGLRALRLDGPRARRGVLSLSRDVLIELSAKVPYALFGLIGLMALAPHSDLKWFLG